MERGMLGHIEEEDEVLAMALGGCETYVQKRARLWLGHKERARPRHREGEGGRRVVARAQIGQGYDGMMHDLDA